MIYSAYRRKGRRKVRFGSCLYKKIEQRSGGGYSQSLSYFSLLLTLVSKPLFILRVIVSFYYFDSSYRFIHFYHVTDYSIMLRTTLLATAVLSRFASAHTAAWAKGMYCRNGISEHEETNTNLAVNPLYNLPKEDWWFQHDRGCDRAPPPAGEFLELPANGNFTVELAGNRGVTTLSYDGKHATDWPDGEQHPEHWDAWEGEGSPCNTYIGSLHTYNETNAAGTAWAISYESELEKVTMENLVVFSVLEHTPWKRMATYQVPNLPKCPEGGCTCAWLWVPDNCGQSNLYMQPYKCNVTQASSNIPVAKAQPPVYCADDKSKCVKGAKQMIAYYQDSGNNMFDIKRPATPGYNEKCGWTSGPQRDIFESDSNGNQSRSGEVV
ncbi:unnamed protein product [Periconia digitata]|uniref:Uncharacterized protein n=1 Tax=Periconia digitata TaxID=1303443 RepID=A0A9W4UGB8_9PLEO|nr:unnamed protein product [Periconia digitata]